MAGPNPAAETHNEATSVAGLENDDPASHIGIPTQMRCSYGPFTDNEDEKGNTENAENADHDDHGDEDDDSVNHSTDDPPNSNAAPDDGKSTEPSSR